MIHSFLTQSLPFCEVKFAYFIYLFIHSTHAAIYLLVKHLLNSFLIPGIIPAPERKRWTAVPALREFTDKWAHMVPSERQLLVELAVKSMAPEADSLHADLGSTTDSLYGLGQIA